MMQIWLIIRNVNTVQGLANLVPDFGRALQQRLHQLVKAGRPLTACVDLGFLFDGLNLAQEHLVLCGLVAHLEVGRNVPVTKQADRAPVNWLVPIRVFWQLRPWLLLLVLIASK